MKTIKGVVSYFLNNKEIMMISNDYKGSPIIGYRETPKTCSLMTKQSTDKL